VEYRPDLLMRVRDTKAQTSLSRAERLENVRDAFTVSDVGRKNLAGRHVYIVDDVTTTGATLSEATRALQKAGATVTAIALARA